MNEEPRDFVLNRAGRVGRNAALLIVAQVVSGLCGMAYALLVTRRLGPELFGVYAGAVAAAALAGLLLNPGPGYLITREAARDPNSVGETVTDATLLALLILPLTLAVAGLLAWRSADPRAALAIPIAVAPVFARTVLRFCCSAFEGLEQMIWSAAASAAAAVLSLAAVFLLYLPALRSPVTALLIDGVGAFAAAALAVAILRRVFKARPAAFSAERFRRFAWRVLPFWTLVGASVVLVQVDVFLLMWLGYGEQAGLYRAAMYPIMLAEIVPNLAVNALYPAMSRHADEAAVLQAFAWRSFKNLVVVGMGLTLLLFGLSEPLILLAYGREFQPAAALLKILCFLLPLKFGIYALSAVVYAKEREKIMVPVLGASAVLSVLANVALILRYGSTGAAAAAVISFAVLLAGTFLVARRSVRVEAWRLLPGLTAGTLLYAGAFWLLRPAGPWVQTAVAGIAWAAALILFRTIDPLDWEALKRVADFRGRGSSSQNKGGNRP